MIVRRLNPFHLISEQGTNIYKMIIEGAAEGVSIPFISSLSREHLDTAFSSL